MPKYKFRLATLQRIREARRDRERAALAEAFHAEQVLAEHRAALETEQAELREMQRAATRGEYLDVNRLIEAQRYELVLKSRESELIQQQAAVEVEAERRRQVLVEAERDVRALEILDEHQRREHGQQRQRIEAKQLDEVAIQRHGMAGSVVTW
jgi:flagellar FliJ protein